MTGVLGDEPAVALSWVVIGLKIGCGYQVLVADQFDVAVVLSQRSQVEATRRLLTRDP